MTRHLWFVGFAVTALVSGCASADDEDPIENKGGSAGSAGSGGAVTGSGGSGSGASGSGSTGGGGAGGTGGGGTAGTAGTAGVGGSAAGAGGTPSSGSSCVGKCGGPAAEAEGSCWCDDLCSQNGDCCADYASACPGGSGAGGAGGAAGSAGSGSPGPGCTQALCNTEMESSDANGVPCYCDQLCAQYGDCCANKTQICGG